MEVILEKHFVLAEVSKILGRKPHQIVHLLTSGRIAEPEQRNGNRRLFSAEEVARLAHHFKVMPRWTAVEPATTEADTKASERLTLQPPFEVLQVGETGHEIRDGDGEIFAWTSDRGHALVVAGLLEGAVRG
jgi:MerR HTH family regulatory protein